MNRTDQRFDEILDAHHADGSGVTHTALLSDTDDRELDTGISELLERLERRHVGIDDGGRSKKLLSRLFRMGHGIKCMKYSRDSTIAIDHGPSTQRSGAKNPFPVRAV